MANIKLVHSICIVLFVASEVCQALPHRSREDRGLSTSRQSRQPHPKYRNQIVSSRAGKYSEKSAKSETFGFRVLKALKGYK